MPHAVIQKTEVEILGWKKRTEAINRLLFFTYASYKREGLAYVKDNKLKQVPE